MMALFGLVDFAMHPAARTPRSELGRKSRFFGSHLGPAPGWSLFMIFNVIWTMFLFRGAASAAGNLPYDSGAFVSIGVGNLLDGLSHDALETLEGIGLLLHIGVMLVFLIFVLNSKHLHIFLAPLNVLFGRRPGRARRRQAADVATASRSPSTTSRTSTRTRSWASARSRTSAGRASSTSRPAPSAVAARTSARPGTPRSRSRRS